MQPDYSALATQLLFPYLGSGVVGSKECFFVSIVDDVLVEGSETLILSLSNPLGDPVEFQPNPGTTTVYILSNDGELWH